MEGFSYNKRSVLEKYDSAPTANSTNLVPSGGIKTYVDTADATINAKVDDMISRVGNPFVFKGTVAALTDLPGSGNTVNDTYFVTAEGFMYTWNGTSWDKTSTDVNNQLAHDIATEYDATKADYKAGNIVMYNNQVYVRNADATAAEGTFVAANWTATSIGDELSEEITNLKSALGVQNLTLVVHDGYFIGNNGQILPDGGFAYSDPVAVSEGDRIIFIATGYTTAVAMISTCAADGTNISVKVKSNGNSESTYEYYVQEDGYVCFSYKRSASRKAYIIANSVLFASIDERDNAQKSYISKVLDFDAKGFGNRLQNYDGYIFINPADFIIGGIYMSTSGWTYQRDVNTRISTKQGVTLPLKAGDYVTLSDYTDARFFLGWKLQDETYKTYGWVDSGGYTLVDDAEYVILISNKTEVAQSDIYDLLKLLTIYRGTNTQSDVSDIQSTIEYITGVASGKIFYTHTYTNTGTSATVWEPRPFPAETKPKFFRVSQAEGLGTGITNYGNLFAHYTDGSSEFVSGTIAALNTWVPTTVNENKEVSYYDCVCHRGTVSESTTSTWTVDILCGEDILNDIDELRNDIDELRKSSYGLNNPLFKPCSARFAMHRGYSTLAPENTVPAFMLAGKAGAFAVETDIQETTDGVFMCFHDTTVDRMTDGTGSLYQKTYAQVQALTIDAGANIDSYPNLKIPTMAECLNVCRRYGCVVFLHIGVVTHYDVFVNTIRECGMLDSCVILMGYSEETLQTVRRYTDAPVAILKYTDVSASIEDIIALANSQPNCVASFDASLITDDTYMKQCHSLNLPTNVWVIDDAASAEQYFAREVDVITSNSIPKLSNE